MDGEHLSFCVERDPIMECIATIAFSAAVIFARLALMQDLNPFLWGFLALVVYVGPPIYLIQRGAGWMDSATIWLSSFLGLFALFFVQTVIAARMRLQARSGPSKPSALKSQRKRSRPRN